jgi:glycosyltransferase involved in cell wall biosynthesis
MKIGIISPYFDSLGGGERYMFAIAARAVCNHSVDVFWEDVDILQKAGERFNLDLRHVRVVKNIFAHGTFMQKLAVTKTYDVLIFLTDGSIPFSLAKHTLLHVQVPFSHVTIPFWKKWRFDAVIYNSKFTKEHVDQSLATIPGRIIYPPVTAIPQSTATKTKQILSVGRFGGLYNAKKFDVIVDAFEMLIKEKAGKGYTLALAGGVLQSDTKSFEELKKRVAKLPVTLYPDCPYTRLISLYEQSTVYWHAAGYGENKPENMEHFGIAPVEAMSAGTVPVVYNGGGLPEIVTDGSDGFVWNTPEELISKTKTLLTDAVLYKKMSESSIATSMKFSTDAFNAQIDVLLGSLR